MLACILIVSLAYTWLLWETQCLTIRLPVGIAEPASCVWLTGLWLNTFADALYGDWDWAKQRYISEFDKTRIPLEGYKFEQQPKEGYEIVQVLKPANYREHNNHHIIFVSPCIKDVLCGKEWLDKHWADLEDYHPEVQMTIAGIRYNMTIRKPEVIKDIMRANKLTRKQKEAYI